MSMATNQLDQRNIDTQPPQQRSTGRACGRQRRANPVPNDYPEERRDELLAGMAMPAAGRDSSG